MTSRASHPIDRAGSNISSKYTSFGKAALLSRSSSLVLAEALKTFITENHGKTGHRSTLICNPFNTSLFRPAGGPGLQNILKSARRHRQKLNIAMYFQIIATSEHEMLIQRLPS